MARLFGREWTRREIQERVGDLSQVAGVETFAYDSDTRDGVRAARVWTGGGLEFTALLSRCMDISHASYKGIPLAWISPTGEAHPHSFEPEGKSWLRTFYGGLLLTCGLSNVGAESEDPETGEPLGIHGRISHSPAGEGGVWTEWSGDDAEIHLAGTMRVARVFGENLRLVRRIIAPVGENTIRIEDRVENHGFRTSPLMLLYHMNFGWPLVSEDTEIVLPSLRPAEARDEAAASGIADWHRLEPPQPGYAEQVFFHDPVADEDGMVPVLLINRAAQIAVRVAYDSSTLPYMTQWKMMGQGEYVCGIEPGTCRVMGRAAEQAAGRLQHIEPGGERRVRVSISVLDGAEAIAAAEEKVKALAAVAAFSAGSASEGDRG